jgi:trk system potassium uptake protein
VGLEQNWPGGRGTLRTVTRDVGALQIVLGGAMLLPLAVSLIYGEFYSAAGFLLAGSITAGAGAAANRACRDAPEPERHHAMLIAGAGWLVSAVFGSLPFLLIAHLTPAAVAARFVPGGESYVSSLLYFRNPLHAVFESMSAYTTTGLTMAVHEPSVGRGVLFYRSLAQWIGGVGVIVLSLAIVPRPRAVGGLELYQSETAGMKLRPRILGTAREIWKIYAVLTLFSALWLFVSILLFVPGYGPGRALFDSVNHAMTGQATGGFSTLDDSIAGYGSLPMELVHLLPMLLGVIAIPLYYTFLRERDLRVFWRDAQFRLMLIILAITIPALALLLTADLAVASPLRTSVFQVISALSGTGWQTADIGAWGSSPVLLLAFGTMIVGGAAGSTAGGFKLIRAYILLRAIGWRVRKVFMPPEAVLPFKVGPRYFPMQAMQREVGDAAVISFLYIIVLAGSMVVVGGLAGPGFTLGDAIFECVSAQGTVGLSAGITSPDMNPVVELVFILQMWVGRLEVFPVIVLVSALYSWIVRR